MALITRLVTNAGAPLSAPDGALLENTKIIFVLVNKVGAPADAWDAATNERVGGDPIIVTTDAKGEFSVELWPNRRGDRLTRYHCTVQHPGFRAFYGVVEESAEPLSWAYFMANGGPLSPQEISQLQQYLANMNAAKNAAADYAAESSASAALANDWATKTSSEVVPGQGFGAKKYALDAEQSAINAETSFQSGVNAAQVLVDGFRTYRTVSTSLPSGVPRQGEEWIVVQ